MDKTIVFAGEAPSSTLLDRVRRGTLTRIAVGVYSSDVNAEPVSIVRREWHTIVGHLFPDAVITDRSSVTGGPMDGYLYLSRSGRARETALPGMTVLARPGVGPLEGDIPLPGGLYQASKPRALIENARPSRARAGHPRRTLSNDEVADWVDKIAMIDGEEKLMQYREAAEQLADILDAPPNAVVTLSRLIGAALGTQRVQTSSAALSARQLGAPYDRDRIRLLGVLIEALHRSPPQNRPVTDPTAQRYRYLPLTNQNVSS